MNKSGEVENQHYISRLILRRFINKGTLKRYWVHHGTWGNVGLDAFSNHGYTQLILDGKIDNTLETEFNKVEVIMNNALREIDTAINGAKIDLSVKHYRGMCLYLAFLHCLSPFFKASCPEDFLHDLHVQIINGNGDLLNAFKLTPIEIAEFKEAILNGQKLIIDSNNFLQFLHRIQFNRLLKTVYYYKFRHFTTWHVCRSPIDLPLSDVAITPILAPLIHLYSLPISPRLLLVGRIPQEASNGSSLTTVHFVDLPLRNAENWKDLICLQARAELVSKEKIADIKERRARAAKEGHAFANIKNIAQVKNAGTIDNISELRLKLVTQKEFEAFNDQFVTNNPPPDILAGGRAID